MVRTLDGNVPAVSAIGRLNGHVGHVRTGPRAESIATINAAVDEGIRLLDTSISTARGTTRCDWRSPGRAAARLLPHNREIGAPRDASLS